MNISSLDSTSQRSPNVNNDIAAWRWAISHLYMKDDKTLAQVMSEMKKIHGFSATERQYKRKIAEWRLDKNVKDNEMRYIIQIQTFRRVRIGKESTFQVRGRPVPSSKIERFRQRKGLRKGADRPLDARAPGDTDLFPDIRWSTPEPEERSSSGSPEPIRWQGARSTCDESRNSESAMENEVDRPPEINVPSVSPFRSLATDLAYHAPIYNSLVLERLHQANNARAATQDKPNSCSPFREGSPFAFSSNNSAAYMRELAKNEADAVALAQHLTRSGDSASPITISPKNAFLEDEEKNSLFPEQSHSRLHSVQTMLDPDLFEGGNLVP